MDPLFEKIISLPELPLSQEELTEFFNIVDNLSIKNSKEFLLALTDLKEKTSLVDPKKIKVMVSYLDEWEELSTMLTNWNDANLSTLSSKSKKETHQLGCDDLLPFIISLLPEEEETLQKMQKKLDTVLQIETGNSTAYTITLLFSAIKVKLDLNEALNEAKKWLSLCQKAQVELLTAFEKELNYRFPFHYSLYYDDNNASKEEIINQIISYSAKFKRLNVPSFLNPQLELMLDQYNALDDLLFTLKDKEEDVILQLKIFNEKKDVIYKDLLKNILHDNNETYLASFLTTLKYYTKTYTTQNTSSLLNLNKFSYLVWRSTNENNNNLTIENSRIEFKNNNAK